MSNSWYPMATSHFEREVIQKMPIEPIVTTHDGITVENVRARASYAPLSPTQRAMDFAFSDRVKKYPPRRGRHRANLLSAIEKDCGAKGTKFKTSKDLVSLRKAASERVAWRSIGNSNRGLIAKTKTEGF